MLLGEFMQQTCHPTPTSGPGDGLSSQNPFGSDFIFYEMLRLILRNHFGFAH